MKDLKPERQLRVRLAQARLLPATRPVGAAALLVVFADGGRLAVRQVV